MNAQKIRQIRPAFIHNRKSVYKDGSKRVKRFGVVQFDPMVWKGVENSARHTVITYMPISSPLVDWIGYDKGAYFFRGALKRVPKDQLKTVFKALNTLGNTKWRKNKELFCVIERIRASGGGMVGLMDRDYIPISASPDTNDASEIRNWHSQRCAMEFKLAVDEEGFYYPHNLDFRGHSVKIHIYAGGVDTPSHEGRIAFTDNHLDDIFDFADRPLEALRSSSPEDFVSHVTVHKLGAKAVNLVAGDKPADVYSDIAKRYIICNCQSGASIGESSWPI